jgi:salicylate hydroxylase
VPEITEIGAGIQLAPNSTRILGRFGVLPKIMKPCNFIKRNSLRSWKDNEELGTAPLMPVVAEKFGAPMAAIHRGDLQMVLLEAARTAGVDIRTNQKVNQSR